MMEKAVFLACSNAWLSESVNGKLLAISEAQGSRGKKARQKEGVGDPGYERYSFKLSKWTINRVLLLMKKPSMLCERAKMI